MYAVRLQYLVPYAKEILTCYELPKLALRNAGVTDAKSTPQGKSNSYNRKSDSYNLLIFCSQQA